MKRIGDYFRNPYKIFESLAMRGFFKNMNDKEYLSWLYRARMGRFPDLNHPKSFNEKLQWLKLNDRKPEYTEMVDKYLAKKYVEKRIGEKYIIGYLFGATLFGRYVRRSGAFTLSEYFGKRFKSKKLQKLAGFTTIVAVTAYMLSAIQGISTLMSSITGFH